MYNILNYAHIPSLDNYFKYKGKAYCYTLKTN